MPKPTLWQHQQKIVDLARARGSLLVAADMGTGKSLAALVATLDSWFTVIICPVAVGPAWQRQFQLWDADRTVFAAFDGPAAKRMKAVRACVDAVSMRRALLLNYDWFWRDEPLKALLMAALTPATAPGAIIADESHRAKSPSSRASRGLHTLAKSCKTAMRLALTGTPMPLGPQDVYGQSRFVDATVFGTNYRSFLSQFFHTDPMYPSRVTGTKNVAEFQRRLDSIMFRCRADDVLDLPDALHERVAVVLPPAVAAAYRRVEREIAMEVAGGMVTLTNGMVRLLRLQQATSSYIGTDAGDRPLEEVPAKIRAIEDWLADLEPREPVAVFCRFAHDLAQLREMCGRIGRRYAELSGREKTLAAWQRGEADFLGVQIQAGGVGVDLTRCGDLPCRYVGYMSVGFNGGDYQQSLARVRRPGQKSNWVRYYHFVVKGSIDEAVYGALQKKRNVVEDVLDALLSREHREVRS
jgi:SNF2 family DNA or RNA helicase